jgi:hypothetical protein
MALDYESATKTRGMAYNDICYLRMVNRGGDRGRGVIAGYREMGRKYIKFYISLVT